MLTAPDLMNRLLSAGLASPETLIGCKDHEIAIVERHVGLALPAAYKEFLAAVGKKAGVLYVPDVDIFFPKVLEFKSVASETLQLFEENGLRLPETAFVFSHRYGEQFLFFLCDGTSDNPEVHSYHEGGGYFDKPYDHFWDAIEKELRFLENFKRDFPDSPTWEYLQSFNN